jgi:predicted ferric reductase
MKETDSSPWKPYESRGINAHRALVATRWALLNPFAWRALGSYTFGELFLASLFVAYFVVISYYFHGQPDYVVVSGEITSVTFAMTFALAARNSIFSVLFGLPFERAILWHQLFAVISFGLAVWHGVLNGYDPSDPLTVSGLTATCAAGTLMLALLWPIRRKAFELFYRFHWAGFLLLLAAALAHGAYYIVAGAGLWFLDVLFRYFSCRNSLKERNNVVLLPFRLRYGYQASCKHSRKATIEVLPADVVRVTIPTLGNFTYRPGQYIFLCVPEIGLFEWHPFSISSAPCESAKVRKEIHHHVLSTPSDSLGLHFFYFSFKAAKCHCLMWLRRTYQEIFAHRHQSDLQ